ncbi:MAG TPA: Arm DNA-binding domain-containing protein, partial [Burkholderiales bacterium]|nr:Arm DNA-binding domain-containing protein [Burkholderiales bacterium]
MSRTADITDREVRAFIKSPPINEKTGKPKRKLRVGAGSGLYLFRSDAHAHLWRYDYRLGDKEKVYSFGEYPQVTLENAREQLNAIKEHLKYGRDPVQERKIERIKATTASFS